MKPPLATFPQVSEPPVRIVKVSAKPQVRGGFRLFGARLEHLACHTFGVSTRDHVVSLRLTDAEYGRLQRLAEVSDRTPSDVIRSRVFPSGDPCPTCGTTILTIDPPLVIDEAEACGQLKPGTYAASASMPFCELAKGHDGDHLYLLEDLITWAETA